MTDAYDLAARIVRGGAELPKDAAGTAAYWHGYVRASRRTVRTVKDEDVPHCRRGCEPAHGFRRAGERYWLLPARIDTPDDHKTACEPCAIGFVAARIREAGRMSADDRVSAPAVVTGEPRP